MIRAARTAVRTSAVAIAALAASWLTAVPAARALPMRCAKSPYDVDLAVVYANGMLTTHGRAIAAMQRIRPQIDARLGLEPYAIAYGVAYNAKKDMLASLRKTAKERLAMSAADLVRMLSGLLPRFEDIDEQFKQLATEIELAGFEGDPSLERHVQIYRDHLRSGRKVLVLAHSEGNMYANVAYRRLFESALPTPGQHSFGIVGVATPTDDIAGWHPESCPALGCYTTLQGDMVINFVRSKFSDTAEWNALGPGPSAYARDALGHGLIEAYFGTDRAREQILDQVAAFVGAFDPLEPTINDSTLSATLEWNTDADLDLHVFEPSREHVYTEFPDVGRGHMDADDQDGFGPEHYYTECAELERGAFRFAVGYFDGSGPVEARLQIKVGNSVRTISRVLDEPLGEFSLTNPESFATLDVKDRDVEVDRKDRLIREFDVVLYGQ